METRIDPGPAEIWNDDTPAIPVRIGNVQEPVSGEIVLDDEAPVPVLDRDWEEAPDADAIVGELVSGAGQSAAAAAWRDRYL